jgi:mRNA interferase MazF
VRFGYRFWLSRQGPARAGCQRGLGDQDRALIRVAPHTTSLRGSPFEIAVRLSFLQPGAFLVQGITTFPAMRALHRLGVLPPPAFEKVIGGLLRWLGHFPAG